jgi:hypothetical protein
MLHVALDIVVEANIAVRPRRREARRGLLVLLQVLHPVGAIDEDHPEKRHRDGGDFMTLEMILELMLERSVGIMDQAREVADDGPGAGELRGP